MLVKDMDINSIKEYENNPRRNDDAVRLVANSIKEFGFKVPIVIDKNNVIVAGHTRIKAARKLGMKKIPCIVADDLTEEQIKAFRLADNKTAEAAEWDIEKLTEEINDILDIDMSQFGFGEFEVDIKIDDENDKNAIKNPFLFYPLSVLSSRGGKWQERKKAWTNLGIKSYESRDGMKTGRGYAGSVPNYYRLKQKCEEEIGHSLTNKEFDEKYLRHYYNRMETVTKDKGILSIFDPVLTELMYSWFCIPGGGNYRPICRWQCSWNCGR